MFVILCNHNGRIFLVDTGEGDDPPAATFATFDEAREAADKVPICRVCAFVIIETP